MDHLTNPHLRNQNDEFLDHSLRPKSLTHYYGQTAAKNNLLIAIQAAQKRNEPLDHLLLYGPPGTGKTTLAKIIGHELNVNVRLTSGPAIERAGDLASILTNLENGDILFIDEVHRLNRVVEETLYPAMEEFALDLVMGRGPSARTMRLELPKFTLVAATTRVGMMSAPIRDRFGTILRLDYYQVEELCPIIEQSAQILQIQIHPKAIAAIAQRSRGIPRIANRLLKRIRDYAQINGNGQIDPNVVEKACALMGIDAKGLDELDRKYLTALSQHFSGGPAGIETLAAALSEDIGTLQDVVEPFLIQQGLLQKTPRGRTLTQKSLALDFGF